MNIRPIYLAAMLIGVSSTSAPAFDLNKLQQGLGGMIVRRHINWNTQGPDLKEGLAHLVQDIKRRVCGIASAGIPSFSV